MYIAMSLLFLSSTDCLCAAQLERRMAPRVAALTADQTRHVTEHLLTRRGPPVVISRFSLDVSRADLLTLSPGEWLNDEVINFYLQLIVAHASKPPTGLQIHAFNTFFYAKLSEDGYGAVRRWTKRVDIFAKDVILVPIHLGMHWCMAAINMRKKRFEYYDSLGGKNSACLRALREYVVAEHADKKGGGGGAIDLSGWTDYMPSRDEIPQQKNGFDCGVFACMFAEAIARDAPFAFTQKDMPALRQRMAYEIAEGKLIEPA